MKTCISNPPYNLKWEPPIFAQIQQRFVESGVPPKGNANYAFVLSALEETEKAAFILPIGVLTTNDKEEKEIKKYLVEKNYIEAVIMCPDNMFEATSIPVCILVLNKKKTTSKIMMIDMRDVYQEEIRKQRGQFGSNTKRVYEKKVKIFTDEQIEQAINVIKEQKEIKEYSKAVSIEDVKSKDYNLAVSIYLDKNMLKEKTRKYDDIINDLNRVIADKNVLKLTMNETIAKSIGIYDLFLSCNESKEINKLMNENLKKFNITEKQIIEENFIQMSRNKNEIKFENNSKEKISDIFLMIFQMWKQHIYYLNNEENRYLAELRDKLLPELMSGKINLDK